MKRQFQFVVLMLMLGFLLVSCAPAANTPTTGGNVEPTKQVAAPTTAPAPTTVVVPTAAAAPTTAAAPTAAPATKAATDDIGKDTLIVANTAGEPGNLHPFNTVSAGGNLIMNPIMEPLVKLDADGNPAPLLAESWELTDKGVTFHIRKGVKFHNGETLKASDVVFTIKEIIQKSTGGLAALFDVVDVNNVKATDDYTVVVPMTQPNASILSNFTSPLIVSEKAYVELGSKFQYQPVGTGPFMFGDWTVGDHVTLKRFDGYWGGPAKLKSVTYRTIADVSQAMVEVQTGGVDVAINPQGSDIKKVLNNEIKNVKAVSDPKLVLRNNNLNFNFRSEPISKLKVRQAIAYAIDRVAWTPIISPGNGAPAYSNLPAGVWGYDPNIAKNYPYNYNLDKAKALMAEAGYAKGFEAVLLTDTRPYHLASVELIQNALGKIGINVKIQQMELAKQKEIMVTGKGFDMYMLDNVGNAGDPLSPIWRDSHPKFATENSSQYHFYTVNNDQGQKYADLLDAIRVTSDPAKRKDLCSQMQQVFVQDAVWLPLNSIQSYVLANTKVQNISFFGDIFYLTNQVYVSK